MAGERERGDGHGDLTAPGAFRRAVRAFGGRVYLWVRPFAADDDGAEDLTQEVWRRAFQRRSQLRDADALGAWLYAISRSVCLDHVRRESARAGPGPTAHLADAHGPTHDPLEGLAERETRRTVHEAVMALPERQREVVVLRMFEGLSTSQTATRMGCAEGTVKASLSHAIDNLRKRLTSRVEQQ